MNSSKNAKRYYWKRHYHLLNILEQAGFLTIPPEVHNIVKTPSLIGLTAAAENIAVVRAPTKAVVVYVQPNVPQDGSHPQIIPFSEFGAVVRKSTDPISTRFAQSLAAWSDIQAGHIP